MNKKINDLNIMPMPNKINLLQGECLDINKIEYVIDKSLKEQEYNLIVKSDGIKISYATELGKIYANTTLEQLKKNKTMRCVEIKDCPIYNFRGLLIDVARNFVDTEKMKQIIDVMAYYKLNVLHLHLTDDQGFRIEIKKYPLLTEKGSIRKATQKNLRGDMIKEEYGRGLYYTQEQMIELVDYAKAKGIDILPEFDIPGHMLAAISNYPKISCNHDDVQVRTRWGVEDIIGCAGSEYFYEFIKDVIDELAVLFPYEYFHIGGDEVPKKKWKKCPKCQAKMKELGLSTENELQGFLANYISDYLKKKGKKTIVWDEKLGVEYNKDIVLQWWRKEINRAQSIEWLKKGNNAIVSYGPYFYFNYPYANMPLRHTYLYTPRKLKITNEMDKNVVGVEACVWTEYIRDYDCLDFKMYPRLQAFAENAWTSEKNRDFDSFLDRLDVHKNYLKNKNIVCCTNDIANPKGIKRFFQYFVASSNGKDYYGEYRKFKKMNKK